MNNRELFYAVMRGENPCRVPFVPDITDWYVANRCPAKMARPYGPGEFIPDDAEIHRQPGTIPERFRDWTLLDFHRNFGWGCHFHIGGWVRTEFDGGVERVTETSPDGRTRTMRYLTPLGELRRVDRLSSDGTWGRHEFYVKDLADLRIMRHVVENMRWTPDYGLIRTIRDGVGGLGQCDVVISRSPFGKLVHEMMGFETVIYAMADDRAEMESYIEFQAGRDMEYAELAAEAPEDLVIMSDHTDEILISPTQWAVYCVPFYQRLTELLHSRGKYVSSHLDGNFRGYFPKLGLPGFDLLDGCTPAPMFNYEVEELAEALPEGACAFVGVPSTLFCQRLPTDEILRFADRIIEAFGGRAILNVGDILPPNGDIEQVIALGEHVGAGRRC